MDNTLIQAGLASAEALIQKALKYDPASQQKLQRLAGRTLGIHVQQPDISVYVCFTEHGDVRLQSHFEGETHASLTGELFAFINIATSSDKHAALMKSDLQIHGSSQLALSLADLMNDLDIDWEAMVTQVTGPIAAHILGKGVRGINGWLKQAGKKLLGDVTSYVRDEAQLAPDQWEAEEQFRQIHQLRMDTERLEARIQRLAAKLK